MSASKQAARASGTDGGSEPTVTTSGEATAVDRPPGMVSAQVGRYELLGRLARGGMAELFLARTSGVGGFEKVVVLKRILPQFAHDPEFNQMFLAEARLAGNLDHPNVVRIYDVGQQGSNFFFTMEYIHGEDLRGVLKAAAKSPLGMPLDQAIAIIIAVCNGLHYAHECSDFDGEPLNIVHRDVSPANVLVTYRGGVKVVDFGIARAKREKTLTQAGQRKGKLAYMSPEQCRGLPLDRRSDVFAIGILLYEMTTLHRLFRADDEFATMHKIVNEPIPLPSDKRPGYPDELETIVLRALAKDPNDRYDTALDLQLDLEAFAKGNGLDVSARGIASYLTELLGERPFPWKDRSQLEPIEPGLAGTAVPLSTDPSGSALRDMSYEVPVEPAPQKRTGLIVGLVVTIVALIGVSAYALKNGARSGNTENAGDRADVAAPPTDEQPSEPETKGEPAPNPEADPDPEAKPEAELPEAELPEAAETGEPESAEAGGEAPQPETNADPKPKPKPKPKPNAGTKKKKKKKDDGEGDLDAFMPG